MSSTRSRNKAKKASAGGKAARVKAPSKPPRTAKKASRPSVKTAKRAARPRSRRDLPAAVTNRVPAGVQVSWGAMVDSMNARVAARQTPVWDLLAQHMAASKVLPPPLPKAANIETGAPDGVRAYRFLAMARACVADLHGGRPLAARENMARFLLHVAWHGSKLRFRRGGRKEAGDGLGAVRGLVPFEAHRAKDTLIRLARTPADRIARRLGELAGLGWPGLVRAAHSLPDWGTGGRGAAFPDGHLIEGLLERSDQFNVYLARAAFLLIPPAVPVGNTNHAQYWFAFWRIAAPDPEALQLAFRREADAVDGLIDG